MRICRSIVASLAVLTVSLPALQAAQTESLNKRAEEQTIRAANEIIDGHVGIAQSFTNDQQWANNRERCYEIYRQYEGFRGVSQMGQQREISGKEGWLREGQAHADSYIDFVAYFIWRLKNDEGQTAKKDHHCGHYFAKDLDTEYAARSFALAAFNAHHHVYEDDDKSASMMEALYSSDRGNARRDLDKASQWRNKKVQRRAKLAGKIGEPVQSKERKFNVLDYGEVPESFAPQVPTLFANNPIEIRMDKMVPGSLETIRISPFGRWHLRRSDLDYMYNRQLQQSVRASIDAVIASGARVIECEYVGDRYETKYFYRFWYKSRPAVADPGRLNLKDHPLKYIRPALTQCPAAKADAKAHR